MRRRYRPPTSQGDSGYGAEGSATPVAAIPGGGSTLALRATTDTSRQADLDWLAPANNGATITGYTYQWRTAGQAYSTGRQGTTATLTATVSNLANGTQYFFQVYATNSVGDGPVSNESDATPSDAVPPPPASTVPDAPTNISSTPRVPLIVEWLWEVPDDNGGERIEDYDFQWRYDGDAWAPANLTSGLESTYYRLTVANANNGVQARARARNSVGTSAWVTSVVLAAGSLLPGPPANSAPDAPTALAGTPRRPLTIDWVWELPDNNGGTRISSYDFQWRVRQRCVGLATSPLALAAPI